MEVYLDNAATTQCLPAAARRMMEVLTEDYGNPSSLHRKGMEAEAYIRSARKTIAKTLKALEKEIIFTSGGTESNNLAIFGAAHAKRRQGRHVVTTMIEHPSVNNPMAALEEEGFEVTYLPVDEAGVIRLEQLKDALREDTILVSIMHVNNEIGAVEPVEEIGQIVHEEAKKAVFHVDAIQSYGKLALYPKRCGVNLLSVSGHKLHGPKGSGFLFVDDNTRIVPILYGGGQEQSLRSGTENVAAIAGLEVAVEEAFSRIRESRERMYELRQMFLDGLSDLEDNRAFGSKEQVAPHIISVSFSGIRSEVLLHALEEKGIYVSAGSACSSNRPAKSRTLMAIGASDEALDSTVRFSLSDQTTKEELEYVLVVLKELTPRLRMFQRR